MNYLWQKANWINFRWNSDLILESLSIARKSQGYILGKGESLNLKDIADFVATEAITTSEIEGETLDKDSVRSSVAKKLGLSTAGLPKETNKIDGLVDILLDATTKYDDVLNSERIFAWHAALFPTGYSGINKIDVAKWRVGKEPMKVVSGTMGKKKVHFIAPDSVVVEEEMNNLFNWWSCNGIDGLLRAAIAHFWFVTIHPLDDGNGRIARVLTDMALARDEATGKRLYSLSAQIVIEKADYYRILEETQKGDGDITKWLVWFLDMYTRSIKKSITLIDHSISVNKIFHRISEFQLNDRQLKVMKKITKNFPDEFSGGLTNKKYVSIAKTSPETAKRDIKKLVDLGLIKKNEGKGRSTNYSLGEELIV